jgi:hypothetical protein
MHLEHSSQNGDVELETLPGLGYVTIGQYISCHSKNIYDYCILEIEISILGSVYSNKQNMRFSCHNMQ